MKDDLIPFTLTSLGVLSRKRVNHMRIFEIRFSKISSTKRGFDTVYGAVNTWSEVFKNGAIKICVSQPLKKFK